MFADRALERTQVEARHVEPNASQHQVGQAFRTKIWNSGHVARLGSGGSATLSVTGRGRDGAVIGPL